MELRSGFCCFDALAGLALAALLGGFLEGWLRGFLLDGFAAADFFFGVHGAAALLGAAVADGFVVAAVIKAVVVGDLFTGGMFLMALIQMRPRTSLVSQLGSQLWLMNMAMQWPSMTISPRPSPKR